MNNTMKTITEEQLLKIAEESYREGWSESRDSYGYELSRNGYLCGEVEDHLESVLEEGQLKGEIEDIFKYELDEKFNSDNIESLSNKEKVDLIFQLQNAMKELESKEDKIKESLENDAYELLKTVHEHYPISGFKSLRLSYIDEDDIHFEGREYAGCNEYDYYDYELPLNLLYDEEERAKFFQKYKNIEEEKKLREKERLKKEEERERKLYEQLKNKFEDK